MKESTIDPRLLSLLKEIAEMAEEASMSGSLRGGAPQAVQRYNSLLKQFAAVGAVPAGLFEQLDESTDFARLGVESRLLVSYLQGDKKNKYGGGAIGFGVDTSLLVRLAPFVKGEDLAVLVKEYMQQGVSIDPGTLTALAPFLDSGSLGQLLRGFLGKARPEAPQAPEAPDRPDAPESPRPEPSPTAAPTREMVPHADNTPAKPTLEILAARLREPDITPEERQEIAIELAEIAHHHASGL